MSDPKKPLIECPGVLTGEAATAYRRKFFDDHHARRDAYLAECRAEAVATGKEPFSREKVQALWQPERWPGDEIDEAEWRIIEERYVTLRDQVRTIAAFIPHLITLEEWREPLLPTGWEEELEATFGKQPPPGGAGGDGTSE